MRRHSARNSTIFFLAVLLGSSLCYTAVTERSYHVYGDPEYSRKARALLAQRSRYPDRPLVVVLGSSRVAYGVDPQVWEAAGDSIGRRPMMLNMAMVGSGPIMQRLALQRILALNVRIDAVLIEYWPPFLREDGPYHEAARLDPARLSSMDEAVIRDHFPDPAATFDRLRQGRHNPWATHGETVLNRTFPRLLPTNRRTDGHWGKIDAWGHLPGRSTVSAAEMAAARQSNSAYYTGLFDGYEVGLVADAALRATIADCRSRRIAVGFVYLPEAEFFRARMPETTRKKVEHYERHVGSTFGVSWIDGRDWIGDDQLPDGFHLLSAGAGAFTMKLGSHLETVLDEREVTSR